MSPTTVREVLIAEVIGDVGGLIDRAEALVKTVEDVCVALARADAARAISSLPSKVESRP